MNSYFVKLLIGITTCGLYFSSTSNAIAGFKNGQELSTEMRAFDLTVARDFQVEQDILDRCNRFLNYVQGVVDLTVMTDTRIAYPLPGSPSAGQVSQIVSNYLKKHPERWGEDKEASLIIRDAMIEAFPAIR